MFQASVDGEPFDLERWGQFYRPYGMSESTTSSDTPVSRPAPQVQREEVSRPAPQVSAPVAEPKVEQAAPAGDSKAADILALIRSRQKSQ